MGGSVGASKAGSQNTSEGGSLGIVQGGNQATSGSQNQNTSDAWNQASGDSFTQSMQQGLSGGSTSGSSTSTQGVFGAQSPALEALYAQAQGLLGGNAMSQQAGGVADAARKSWLESLSPGGNPAFSRSLQASIDASNDSFRRSIMPELESRGVGAGADYGGVRDQFARGEAAGMQGQGVSRMIAQQSADQYNTDTQARLQALGLTGAVQQAGFAPLTQAAGMIGGPTVLTQGQSTSQGSNWGSNMGTSIGGSTNRSAGASTSQGTGSSGSQSSGWNTGINEAWNKAQGTSSSKSMNVGVGAK